MHPKRKQRLAIVLSIVIGASAAAGLLFFALSDNLNLFYPPAYIVAGKAPEGKRIRAGGMVKKDSLSRINDSLTVQFVVTDYAANVTVQFTGILPDLFKEGQGVVVAGMLDEHGVFQADEVLAKHDENYMPPEVSDALEKSSKQTEKQTRQKSKINNAEFLPKNTSIIKASQ